YHPPQLWQVKSLQLPLSPAFITYTSLPCTDRLIGRVPTEDVRLASDRPAAPTVNTDTSLEPALTAKSRRPSWLRTTAPCEPSPAPVPVPPVATVPAEVSRPSAPRAKTATALPATRVVSVHTAPGPARSPVTWASRCACSNAAAGLVRLRFCSHAASAAAAS